MWRAGSAAPSFRPGNGSGVSVGHFPGGGGAAAAASRTTGAAALLPCYPAALHGAEARVAAGAGSRCRAAPNKNRC